MAIFGLLAPSLVRLGPSEYHGGKREKVGVWLLELDRFISSDSHSLDVL